MSIANSQLRESKSAFPSDVTYAKRGSLNESDPGSVGPTKRENQPIYVAADEQELTLSNKIARLCEDEKKKRNELKGKTRNLAPLQSSVKAAQAELARSLSEMKKLLVGSGRGGSWHPFLKQYGVPLSTADRIVNKHRAAEDMAAGASTKELIELSEVELDALVRSIKSKCRRLTTKRLVGIIKNLEAMLQEQTAEHASFPGITSALINSHSAMPQATISSPASASGEWEDDL